MESKDLENRLETIETRLTEISTGLQTLDELAAKLDNVMKAQILLGALVESMQSETRHHLTKALPQELAAQLKDGVEAEMGTLSGRLAEAIGAALGDRTYADLTTSDATNRPLDIILHDLSVSEVEGGRT